MKKLLVILILASGSLFGQTNLLTWLIALEDDTVLITGLTEDGWTQPSIIVIPSTIDGYPVTAIASGAFAGCGAPGFTLPSTLQVIGADAFSMCGSVESITIPESVLWIPDGCFQGAYSLSTVSLPSAIISIGAYAFADCTLLGGAGAGTFTLPESLLTIGVGSFARCVGLYDLNIPSGVSVIPVDTFYACGFYDIYFSEGLQNIGDTAFSFSSLTDVSFPESLTTIGWCAFEQCTAFGGANLDLKNVTSVGSAAFTYCGFTNAVLTNVTIIPSILFAECNGLQTIELSPSLERIESQAFGRCSLTEMTLPPTINYFAVDSLADVYSLQTLTFLGNMPETYGAFDEYYSETVKIYIQPQANGWRNPWVNKPIANWFWIPDALIKGE